ncbi:peptidase M23 [Kitasatospora sp. NPDC057965]|uniref:peptidase M23 n=1 Tax=Kitasatospora sp. NPDC057965 TaxID=3346291 RepID=UPI0036DC1FDD
MKTRRILTTLLLAGTVATATLAVTPVAQAAPNNGNCRGARAFCFWYNSNQSGSVAGWDLLTGFRGFYDLADAGAFQGPGRGQGVAVKNNAASATYQFPGNCFGYVEVFYNSGWSGPSDVVPACGNINLVWTKNDNASFLVNG